MFWDVLSRLTFDANLFYIFNLSRAHNIKNCVITTALVALDSIGTFNPCNKSSIKYVENPSEETHTTSKPSVVSPVYEACIGRLMITFGIIFCWALCQVDFVKAYPQASIEMDIYMEQPQGIQTALENSKDNLFKLEKKIYSQK